MDLNEAAQRIFRYHWVLILVVTLVGLAVPYALAQLEDDAYVASARIVMGAADARDGQEANALADTALALATSPGALEEALDSAGADRDTSDVAAQVRVDPVGASGVLQISVTDRDPAVSASLANALADRIVQQREEAVLGDSEELLAQTDAQIATLVANVAAIEDEADRVARADAAARARGEAVGNSSLQAIALRHSQAVEQLSRAQGQRQDLAQTLAEAVRPEVIDASTSRGVLVENALQARLAVGALLGLILGVALAATREAWRPTLGPAALARTLGVPLLGHLRRLPQDAGTLPDPWLASYVELAAEKAGVHSFELVPVGPRAHVTGLAQSLARDGDGDVGVGHDVVPVELDGPHDSQLPARWTQRGTGIVVVAPTKVQSTWLNNLERHVQLTRQPVIGVITYGGRSPALAAKQHSQPEPEIRRPVDKDAAPTAPVNS